MKIIPYYSHFADNSTVFIYAHILSKGQYAGSFPGFSDCRKY